MTPAGGVVDPGDAIIISVHLKDPNARPKNKDKFLIRCAGLRSAQNGRPAYNTSIWAKVPKEATTKLFVSCLEHPAVRDIVSEGDSRHYGKTNRASQEEGREQKSGFTATSSDKKEPENKDEVEEATLSDAIS